MSCNCEGKTINIGMGCCQPVLGPIENYYTKYEVDKLIEDVEISGCCITPEQVDEKIDEAISGITVSGVTQEELDEAIASAKTQIEAEIPTVPTKVSAFENDVPYLTEHQSLSGYATEQWVSSFTYDKATIDEKIAEGGTFDPTQYYNKTATNALLDEKLDVTAYTPTDLSNYYNKQEVNNIVESAKTEVEAEIPTVPTNVSAFNNDAGYLTEHQSLSAYSTTNEVTTLINQSVSGKQDTLSAGTGIDITNNVISCTVTGGTGGKAILAGRGINVTTGATADTVSVSLPISAGTGNYSIQEGQNTEATGSCAHSEGNSTKAYGTYAHAEGRHTIASGSCAHAEGSGTTAGNRSHAEGLGTYAYGVGSHAEGRNTDASNSSHAEGYYTVASGDSSHAEGQDTVAGGAHSHAEGSNTITNNYSEHACGMYNMSYTGETESAQTLFSVGNGGNDNLRHNALEIRKNGDIYISSGDTDIKLQDHLGGGGGSTSIGFNYYSSINRFDLDYTTNGGYVKEVAFSVGDGLEVDDTDSANPIIKVDSTSAVTSGSTSLLTSGGAYAALQNVPVIWCGTQQQYDAISPKDPNTLYLIHN